MELGAKSTLKPPSIVNRMHEQEMATAECVSVLENVVAKITGQHPIPTPNTSPQDVNAVESLYGKLADHEEFLRTIISRLTAAANALDVGL